MADATSLEAVRTVLERNKDVILRTYRAVGVGIGKRAPSDRSYVLTVYLESADDLPEATQSVEAVPVQFQVTGRIQPLSPPEE